MDILSCHNDKSTGVIYYISIQFRCVSSRALVLCMLAHWYGLLGHKWKRTIIKVIKDTCVLPALTVPYYILRTSSNLSGSVWLNGTGWLVWADLNTANVLRCTVRSQTNSGAVRSWWEPDLTSIWCDYKVYSCSQMCFACFFYCVKRAKTKVDDVPQTRVHFKSIWGQFLVQKCYN